MECPCSVVWTLRGLALQESVCRSLRPGEANPLRLIRAIRSYVQRADQVYATSGHFRSIFRNRPCAEHRNAARKKTLRCATSLSQLSTTPAGRLLRPHMASAKPVVTVVGSTSKQGYSVAKSLLETGTYTVRAITRNPEGECAH